MAARHVAFAVVPFASSDQTQISSYRMATTEATSRAGFSTCAPCTTFPLIRTCSLF